MKAKIIMFFLLAILIWVFLVISGHVFSPLSILTKDKSWLKDFGYQQGEIFDLRFDRSGCPVIPVTIEENQFLFTFDTGCGSGFLMTSLMEEKVHYTFLGQTEQLNRDGSHRGWSKTVLLDQFTVLGKSYTDVQTTIADWDMFSSEEFNGLIGLKYFASQVITLDYEGRKFAVTDRPIDYGKLDTKKYVALPLLKSNQGGMEHLLFFEAMLNEEPMIVYLDTGKNHSYIHSSNSSYSPGTGKPDTLKKNITISLNDMRLPLNGVLEVNLAQVSDLPYPLIIELNSDQILLNNLLITIDLITQQIVFQRLEV